MNILFYDTNKCPMMDIIKVRNYVKDVTGEDLLALPKDYSLLMDCSKEQLLNSRKLIDDAIEKMEN